MIKKCFYTRHLHDENIKSYKLKNKAERFFGASCAKHKATTNQRTQYVYEALMRSHRAKATLRLIPQKNRYIYSMYIHKTKAIKEKNASFGLERERALVCAHINAYSATQVSVPLIFAHI